MRCGAAALVLALVLVLPARAGAVGAPRYDVPSGFHACPHAQALQGFFKWASVHRTTCGQASSFVRLYGAHTTGGHLPRRLGGFACSIRFWRDAEGNAYASRHVCRKGGVIVRFYGMA